MKTLKDLQLDLLNLTALKNLIKCNVKEYVQNTDNPLNDRWELFINSGYGDINGYFSEYGPFNTDRVGYYDTCFFGKYQTVYTENIIDMITNWQTDVYDNDDCRYFSDIEIDSIKESILSKFEKGFIYDW